MRATLRRLARQSPAFRVLLHPLVRAANLYALYGVSDRSAIRAQYRDVFGREPDLEHPRLFTEKMQWLKLHERMPLLTTCADKSAVRGHVARTIGEAFLVPLVLDTARVADITADRLPDLPVIIKPSHDSGGGIVVMDRHQADFGAIRHQLKVRLKENFHARYREWEYRHVPPRIVAEELLNDGRGNRLLSDFKVHCFNGSPLFVQVILDREKDLRECWYDVEWKPVDCWYFSPERRDVPRPETLGAMLQAARRLAEPFRYVRVDLYEVRGRVLFGEMTFRPYGGLMRWQPPEWDARLGELLRLPTDPGSA